MASPGNQHCVSCVGTLSFPMQIGLKQVCVRGPLRPHPLYIDSCHCVSAFRASLQLLVMIAVLSGRRLAVALSQTLVAPSQRWISVDRRAVGQNVRVAVRIRVSQVADADADAVLDLGIRLVRVRQPEIPVFVRFRFRFRFRCRRYRRRARADVVLWVRRVSLCRLFFVCRLSSSTTPTISNSK